MVNCARCGNIVPYPETKCRVCGHAPFGSKSKRGYFSALQFMACAFILGGMAVLVLLALPGMIENTLAGMVAGVGLMNFGALLAILDRLSELVWKARE